MSDVDQRCLEAFPQWLASLPADALVLLEAVESDQLGPEQQLTLVGALNYLFKSLDLIPDGIEDLGYLDDALVCRVAASQAMTDLQATAPLEALFALKTDAGLAQDFLGDLSERLERYVSSLANVRARGRTASEIVQDRELLGEFAGELRSWASSYAAPSFEKDDKNLIKLRSFLNTKLPE